MIEFINLNNKVVYKLDAEIFNNLDNFEKPLIEHLPKILFALYGCPVEIMSTWIDNRNPTDFILTIKIGNWKTQYHCNFSSVNILNPDEVKDAYLEKFSNILYLASTHAYSKAYKKDYLKKRDVLTFISRLLNKKHLVLKKNSDISIDEQGICTGCCICNEKPLITPIESHYLFRCKIEDEDIQLIKLKKLNSLPRQIKFRNHQELIKQSFLLIKH